MNFVYLTTNLINGKQYVGSHSTNNSKDNYLGSGKALHLAIKKYGRKNFKREILQECELIEDARHLEELFIKQLNTLSPNGYNISEIGGSGIVGKSWGKHDEQTKQKIRNNVIKTLNKPEIRKKISESISGEKNGFYNKHHSEETKRKIGEKNSGKKHTIETIDKMRKSHQGKKFSEEHKFKLSESKKGNKNPMVGIKPWSFGKQMSDEFKDKIRKKLSGRIFSKYEFYKNDKFFKIIDGQKNAKEFCRQNKINFQQICACKNKTWKCKRHRINKIKYDNK